MTQPIIVEGSDFTAQINFDMPSIIITNKDTGTVTTVNTYEVRDLLMIMKSIFSLLGLKLP